MARISKTRRPSSRIKNMLLSENNVLCQIDLRGRGSKPQTLQEYGKLRDYMIQKDWTTLGDDFFIGHVTRRGCTFYGCLFNGHDLMETGQQKLCWRMQTMVGLDFDKCPIEPEVMLDLYRHRGMDPWLVYRTFSDGDTAGRCYRMLWKVEDDLNLGYEEVRQFIKDLGKLANGHADNKSMDPSRMWQGSTKGTIYYSANAAKLNMRKGFPECTSFSTSKAIPGMA
jgi:hypothetical protein